MSDETASVEMQF